MPKFRSEAKSFYRSGTRTIDRPVASQLPSPLGHPAPLMCLGDVWNLDRISYSTSEQNIFKIVLIQSNVIGTHYKRLPSSLWNPHKSSQISHLERIQHYAARFVANDHRRTTSPTTLVLTLNWQTLERRRIIKQAMTFYKILNNIIKISPPSGLLTRSHNRHHYIVPRSRLNTVVYSFYPRAIRIWNTIPKEITEITQPESFQAAISKLPFITPVHLKCL